MITAKKLNSRLSKDISHMIVDYLSILDDDDDDEIASQQRKDLSLLSKMVIFSKYVRTSGTWWEHVLQNGF